MRATRAALVTAEAICLLAANVHADEPQPQAQPQPQPLPLPPPAYVPCQAYGPYVQYYAVVPAVYPQRLMFHAAAGVELQVHDYGAWRTVCVGSCATVVFVGAEYRVTGKTVSTSRVFTMPPTSDATVLYARDGSAAGRAIGSVLAVTPRVHLAKGVELTAEGIRF